MGTMNISLPDALRAFVEEQVAAGGYSTSSEYVREVLRREQDRTRLRALLLAGAESPPSIAADDDYFEALRARISRSPRR